MSKTHISKTNIRFLLTALLLVISINANAITSGQATDEAFAALLSMPGAEPQNGSWIFETPPEFESKTEDNLILWLNKKKKQGADFNAQRHFGTLLDHALRSHLERTALWLLKNGGTSSRDAFSLSLYGNKKVDAVLPKREKLTNFYGAALEKTSLETDQQIEQRDAAAAQPIFLDLLSACADKACVARLFTLNIRRPFDDTVFMLEVIAKINDVHVPIHRVMDAQLTVLDSIPAVAMKKVLDDPQLVQKLIQIFYAAAQYPGNRDEALDRDRNQRSQKMAQPLLKKITDTVLNQTLNDDETMRQWLAWVSINPTEEFKPYLQRISDATLQAHISAAFKGMSTKAMVDFEEQYHQQYNPVNRENWLQFFARLPKTIDFTNAPAILSKTEPEFWPRLFALGYQLRDIDADLGLWLARSRTEAFKQHWGMLLLANPALKQEAIRLVLKPYMTVGNNLGYTGQEIQQEVLDKVLFLLKQGAVAPHLILDPTSMRHSDKAIILQLLALQVIVPLQIPATPRFVPSRLDCQFTLNEAWYRELFNNSVIHEKEVFDTVFIDLIQFVGMPEQNNCAMLVSGTQRKTDVYDSAGEQDDFDGPYEEPRASCPDPTDRSGIWREVAGKIEKLSLNVPQAGLQPLRDSIDGHLYYLSWGGGGNCTPIHWATLMDWQQVDSQWVLKPLDEKHPAQQAFLLQCDPEKIEECLGIKSNEYLYEKERENFLHENPYSSQTPIELINNYKTQEHEAYLAAILELNKPKLEALQAHGIPPQWTAEALQAVNKSALPLADKRQRTAWIFRDHEQLASALRSDIVEDFIDWLPREDWRPVLKALKGNAYLLSNLAEKARTKGLDDLACDFDHARSLMCGETWRVEKVEAQ